MDTSSAATVPLCSTTLPGLVHKMVLSSSSPFCLSPPAHTEPYIYSPSPSVPSSSPYLSGQFGTPFVNIPWIDALLQTIPYDPFVQATIAPAQYWKVFILFFISLSFLLSPLLSILILLHISFCLSSIQQYSYPFNMNKPQERSTSLFLISSLFPPSPTTLGSFQNGGIPREIRVPGRSE